MGIGRTPYRASGTTAEPISDASVCRAGEADFRHRLEDVRGERGFSGATAAVVFDDGTAWRAAAGYADPDANAPMNPDAVMLQASVGKMYIGALARKLATEGLLNLDEPIERHIGNRSWFSRLPNGRHLHLRHLLNHSAGLGDYITSEAFRPRAAEISTNPDLVFPPDMLIGFILDQQPLFEPGKGFAYSDAGYLIAGLVIEAASGARYYDLVRQYFLAPWGLAATHAAEHRRIPGLVPGFRGPNPFALPRRSMENGALTLHPGSEWTGGGWASTASDMAIFAHRLLGGAEKSYRDEIVATGQATPPPLTGIYGLGVLAADSPLGRRFGHGGWTPGYRTDVHCYPSAGFSVAVMVNTDDPVHASRDDVLDLGVMLAALAMDHAAGQRLTRGT